MTGVAPRLAAPTPQDDAARVVEVQQERRRRRRRTSAAVNLARLGTVVVLLGGWQIAAETGLINPFFWSKPSAVWNAFIEEIERGQLLTDIWYTMSASVLGFVIGTALGTAVGLGLWWSDFVAKVVDPFLIGWNAMPKVALAPLVTVILGLGLATKVLMAVLLVSVIAAIAARDGTRSVDTDQQVLLRSLGASKLQIFTKLVVPYSLPWVLSAFRINIGLALIGTVVGEFIGGEHGLGIIAVRAAATYDVAQTWVAVFLLGILAVILYWMIDRLERVLLKGVAGKATEGS